MPQLSSAHTPAPAPAATISDLRALTVPRARLIIDNDFSGDPDGLVQLAHHLLSPSVEIRAVIGSHLRPGDPFDPSDRTADNAAAAARTVIQLLGLDRSVPVIAGSNVGFRDIRSPAPSEAVDAIIAEAMRDDTDLPLYLAFGAGLTEIASAWLAEPRIASRLTLIWIGGPEHRGLAEAPPGATGAEYNLAIDIAAAQVIFNESDVALWQVPRDAYRQPLMSVAELLWRVRPHGALGEHLFKAIAGVSRMAGAHGVRLGETYIMGDSPLVLLTALQSSFEADPSSSRWISRAAPRIDADGAYDYGDHASDGGRDRRSGVGRPIRVYTWLDSRLLFDDLFAKLALVG
jgi:inosine-uridine nucleoside N-ribohydrolase